MKFSLIYGIYTLWSHTCPSVSSTRSQSQVADVPGRLKVHLACVTALHNHICNTPSVTKCSTGTAWSHGGQALAPEFTLVEWPGVFLTVMV
jgi:hypothetical protein